MLAFFKTAKHLHIFHTNTHGYLLHTWSQDYNKGRITDLVAKDVHGKPDIIVMETYIHIYHVNRNEELVYSVVDSDHLMNGAESYILVKGVNINISPSCLRKVSDRKKMHILYSDKENRIILAMHEAYKEKIESTVCVAYLKNTHENVKLHGQASILTYFQGQTLYWFGLSAQINEKQGRKIVQLADMRKDKMYEIVNLNQENYIYFINQKDRLMFGHVNSEKDEQFSCQSVSTKIVKQNSQFSLSIINGVISVDFITSQNELLILTNQSKQLSKWKQDVYSFDQSLQKVEKIGFYPQPKLFVYLDHNQIPIFYHLSTKQVDKVEKIPCLPYLIWPQIKQNCKQIGQQGYYGDCFFNDSLNLVVKRYREPNHSWRVWNEVQTLKILESAGQQIVYHFLYENGIAYGFTMPFYKGHTWDYYIKKQQSIFKASPVARIKLVLLLHQQIKKIHKIDICHGDLHLQNIMIDMDEQQEQDIMNPNFTVRVIDYGNGFHMKQGELVSEGLTGWGPLIPPEVEFNYYTDYNPFGINAYQFARNALFIVLLNPFNAIQNLEYRPISELDELETHKQYPGVLHKWLMDLVHYDIEVRNRALVKDMNFLYEQTKKIFQQNSNNIEK